MIGTISSKALKVSIEDGGSDVGPFACLFRLLDSFRDSICKVIDGAIFDAIKVYFTILACCFGQHGL